MITVEDGIAGYGQYCFSPGRSELLPQHAPHSMIWISLDQKILYGFDGFDGFDDLYDFDGFDGFDDLDDFDGFDGFDEKKDT